MSLFSYFFIFSNFNFYLFYTGLREQAGRIQEKRGGAAENALRPLRAAGGAAKANGRRTCARSKTRERKRETDGGTKKSDGGGAKEAARGVQEEAGGNKEAAGGARGGGVEIAAAEPGEPCET